MPSGNRRIQHNTRERVVSSDPNRLQAVLSADIAEVLRYLVASSSEATAGGVATSSGAVDTPTTAVILNGLLARPSNGTDVLLVDPGTVLMADPDTSPNADDSPWKWIVDGGVQLAGQLVLTPGAGSIRIDVIECKRTDLVLESDNRDLFNAATGLFSPVTVNKVLAGRLTYRIRTGTVGGGFPGTVAGWLPLAVAQVNPGATTWDQVEVWDVRPLASDFTKQPFDVADALPHLGRQVIHMNVNILSGRVEANYKSRKIGGNLGTITVTSSTVQEPGLSPTARQPWYLYLAFPFGLPRWAKYVSSPGARVPNGLRGVPIFSVKGPLDLSGVAGSAISLPTGLGLGGSTSDAQVVASGYYNFATELEQIQVDGERTYVSPGSGVGPSISGTITGAPGPFVVTWAVSDNVHHPANAKSLLVQFSFSFSIPAAGTGDGVTVYTIQGLEGIIPLWIKLYRQHFRTGAVFTLVDDFEMEIPIIQNAFAVGLKTRTIKANIINSIATTTTLDTANLSIRGWKLGP